MGYLWALYTTVGLVVASIVAGLSLRYGFQRFISPTFLKFLKRPPSGVVSWPLSWRVLARVGMARHVP